MRKVLEKFSLLLFLAIFCPASLVAMDLIGTVSVDKTSETAAKAKSDAINAARRQILYDVLSNYSEPESLRSLLNETSDSDLTNFIASSSVSNEHISASTYSANITMNIDNQAVRSWLTMNNVQNWVPLAEPTETFSLYIVVSNVADWGELKNVAEKDSVDIGTITIIGNEIFAKMPLNYRGKFTAGLRSYGLKYADNIGILQVWK